MRSSLDSRYFLILITAACVVTISIYLYLANETFLQGTDAYYYALQADHWAIHGDVRIPDSSPVHRLVGLLQRSGLSTEQSLDLWIAASFLLNFCILAMWGLIRGTIRTWSVIIGLIWFLASPSIFFIMVEFPRMYITCLLFPFCYFFTEHRRGPHVLGFVFSGLLVFAHRGAFPYFLLSVGYWLVLKFYNRFNLRISRQNIVIGLVFIAMTLIYFMGFSDRIHLSDLERLSFHHLQPGVISLLMRHNFPLQHKFEIIISMFAFLWALYTLGWKFTLPVLMMLIPAFVPVGSKEVLGVGERYALILPYFSVLLCMRMPVKRQVQFDQLPTRVILCSLSIVIIFSSLFRLPLGHPKELQPDFVSYDAVTHEIETLDIPMLIAHRGMVYYYKFKTRKEAFPYEPEDHWNKSRIWRLVFMVRPEEIAYYASESCGWSSGLIRPLADENYVLIREDCWYGLRQKISQGENEDLFARAWLSFLNPAEKRPNFLYSKHSSDDAFDEFPAMPK